MQTRILVVDNEQHMCKIIQQSLELEGFEADIAFSGEEAMGRCKQKNYHIVISDLKMEPVDGLTLLTHLKKEYPATEVMLITAFATQKTAMEAMKAGAYDYLIKPFNMDELILRVKRIVEQKRLILENKKLKEQKPTQVEGIVGKSKKMRIVFDLIDRVAPQDVTVLIRGESGTGKELIANALHKQSKRKHKQMLSINCAALPESLLESELFGYEKGAFTGASQQKKGLFERANGSTIFLDEIGDLSLNLQAKLLRVLQNRELIRLGGTEIIAIDVRIITATHCDLEEMIEQQTFRSDLFYRINLFPITLPALRERKEDLPALFDYFMNKYPQKILSGQAKFLLMEYNYPGNIRELENLITRAAIISDSIIEPQFIGPLHNSTKQQNLEENILTEGFALDSHIKMILLKALKMSEGNKSKAAELLGVTRRRLYSLLETHQIKN